MSEPELESATVLEFTPKREYVWQHRCPQLGQTFFLHRDGSVQCADCKAFVEDLVWGKRDQK